MPMCPGVPEWLYYTYREQRAFSDESFQPGFGRNIPCADGLRPRVASRAGRTCGAGLHRRGFSADGVAPRLQGQGRGPEFLGKLVRAVHRRIAVADPDAT